MSYIYTHIYIYIHTHIYIYIYTGMWGMLLTGLLANESLLQEYYGSLDSVGGGLFRGAGPWLLGAQVLGIIVHAVSNVRVYIYIYIYIIYIYIYIYICTMYECMCSSA
jgi:hypothetical protein